MTHELRVEGKKPRHSLTDNVGRHRPLLKGALSKFKCDVVAKCKSEKKEAKEQYKIKMEEKGIEKRRKQKRKSWIWQNLCAPYEDNAGSNL